MCGRFTQHYSWQQVRAFLSVIGAPQNLHPRELHPASESALREWPLDPRVNRTGVGDYDGRC